MDASASRSRAENNEVYGLFLKIENTDFPTPVKQKNTIIKYTKLPEFDFESTVSWPRQSYTLQPRLRRIITLEDPVSKSSRSMNPERLLQSAPMATNLSKRKIVTISEDDEYDLHPRFSKDMKKPSSGKTSNRSVGTDLKEPKTVSRRSTSRISNLTKYSKEPKSSAKLSNINEGKDPKPKSNNRSKPTNISHVSIENTRSRNIKEKETVKSSKSVNASRTSVSKNYITPSESEKELSLIKSKLYDHLKISTTKKPVERGRPNKSPPPQTKSKSSILKELQNKPRPVHIIHVPLDDRCRRSTVPTSVTNTSPYTSEIELVKSDFSTFTKAVAYNDMNISTDPLPEKVDSVTEMDREPQIIYKYLHDIDVQTEIIKETYDSLEIPNVTLTKSESKEESHSLHSKSLPNLAVPPFKITVEDEADTNHRKSHSYIISRAVLTYTTKEKFNLHVVGSNDDAYSNQLPSPLSYPINVVSVFKKEMGNADLSKEIVSDKVRDETCKRFKNSINDIKSLDCSYVANSDQMMKPSDIISKIRLNNGLLRSEICEQFQRELNFIDSFFESLQYLENSSLPEKCFNEEKIDALIKHPELLESELDVNNIEYDSFFSKLENGANTDDSETMASKNLFLLNILIRDEQKRAKNLLFVLKKREDALKEFTKSQILYLESKKKQENTDISALKKKQRGALLKLQHEYGEMQRMRKALVTLSDKRKHTLMKTKKDLELKLKNNVDVDKTILEKKKLKRSSSADRSSPLKCFDLSNSGSDEISSSGRNSVDTLPSPEHICAKPVTSAEKSIQTGDSILSVESVSPVTDVVDENFIIVDGGYLNILFHNLALPQIFSSGKQYEVNEHALRNIVDSSNSQHRINGTEAIESLMDQIKNRDLDRSSTPSTARSLVEELDEYYRRLDDCDKSPVVADEGMSCTVCELSDAIVQVEPLLVESRSFQSTSTMTLTNASNEMIVNDEAQAEREIESTELCVCDENEPDGTEVPVSPIGPLPIPAGAAAVVDTPIPDAPLWLPDKSSSNTTFTDSSSVSSQSLCEPVSSVTSLTAPSHCEAEELRRQQLAIEREDYMNHLDTSHLHRFLATEAPEESIKELEQQQCRMLVVREIPDKPPPPYTPPSAARGPAAPRRFRADERTAHRIRMHMTGDIAEAGEPTDAFDAFLQDFCQETLDRTKEDRSEQPWDSCNLLPPKPQLDPQKLINATASDLDEVLAGAKPTVVSGVSSKRSDHIDDILFAEWRRVEPEWTALHADEAIVKNQIFESIFQRILTDTVDEYKRTVLSDPVND